MQSPDKQSENTKVPLAIGVVEVHKPMNSPSETISQLSQSSSRGRASLSSPLGAKDMGIPKTPPQRVIAPVNEDLIEQGYDSEGLRPPLGRG